MSHTSVIVYLFYGVYFNLDDGAGDKLQIDCFKLVSFLNNFNLYVEHDHVH